MTSEQSLEGSSQSQPCGAHSGTAPDASAPLTALTDDQRVLLEDKFVVWSRQANSGPVDMRDYNRRAAEALKAALGLCSSGGFNWNAYEDEIADAIADSFDMDWNSRDGARAVVRCLNELAKAVQS